MLDQMNILIDKAVFGSRRGSKCLRFFIIDRHVLRLRIRCAPRHGERSAVPKQEKSRFGKCATEGLSWIARDEGSGER